MEVKKEEIKKEVVEDEPTEDEPKTREEFNERLARQLEEQTKD